MYFLKRHDNDGHSYFKLHKMIFVLMRKNRDFEIKIDFGILR